MRLLFELSGEHPTFPQAEVLACLGTEEIVEKGDRVLVVDTEARPRTLASRLALTHCIDRVLWAGDDPSNIPPLEIGAGTFAIRVKTIGTRYRLDTTGLVKDVGAMIDNPVDLTNPDIELRIILSNRCWVGIKTVTIDRGTFEKRRAQFRPFFSPISLHPRIARALVNLSRVKKGDLLLDPFCGTGGILIEAGLMGVGVMGSDSDQRMVEGCKRNLEHFDIFGEVLRSDVGDVTVRADVVVTDLPYGRAATTRREPTQKLYGRALSAIGKAIKPGGYAVVGSPFPLQASGHLELMETHRVRVHKGLSRYFHVYRSSSRASG